MSFYIQAFCINIKKIIKPSYMLAAFWFLVLFGVLCLVFAKNQTVLAIEFGIAADLEDEFSQEVLSAIPQREEFVVHILPLDSWEEARDKVTTGQWECLYVLHEDIGQKVQQNDFMELCDVYISSNSKLHSILNEMLYAAIIKSSAAHITSDEIAYLMDVEYDQIKPYIETQMKLYAQKDIFVTSQSSFVDGLEADSHDYSFAIRLLHGSLSLCLIMVTMFLATAFVGEKKKNFYFLLSKIQKLQYQFSIFSVFIVLNGVLLTVGLLLLRIFYAGAFVGFSTEVLMGAAYVCAVSGIGLLLVCCLRAGDLIYISYIFVLLLHILFGGVLLDVAQIHRFLGSISRLFISNYYIDGLLWGIKESVYLWLCAIGFIFLWLLFVPLFHYSKNKGETMG